MNKFNLNYNLFIYLMAYINRLTDINQNLILLNNKEEIANELLNNSSLSLSNINNTLSSGILNVQVQNTSIPIISEADLNVNVTNASIPVTSASNLNVQVQNASIPVTSASNLNVQVQNASIPVTSASNLNVQVQNASIPVTSASNLNVQVQNASIPVTSASNLNVQVQNTSLNTVTTFASNLSDLFGNLKVSNAFTLLDITHIYDDNPMMMDQYNSGGTVSGPDHNASILMSVTSNTNLIIRQSRLYTQYQPAKSLCIRLTGVINANSNAPSTKSRIGYFDEYNGLFFEYSNNIMKVIERKQTGSSTFNDTPTEQSNWNIDTLDGNGPSGVTVDFSKNIIYYIEFAYLGVGIVKYGVVYQGSLYICHINYHVSLTYPYMVSPNLPVRWELSSSGGAGQLISTCASVQSEGGYNLQGNPFSAGTVFDATGIIVTKQTATYLMSIKLKDNNRRICRLQSINLFCSSSANVIYEIYKCLSPHTTPFNIAPGYGFANSRSSIEYHVNTTGITFEPTTTSSNAILIYKGSFSATTNIDYTNFSNIGGPMYITAGINQGTFYSDYIIIRVYTVDTNQNETFHVSMNWIEV